MHSLFFKEGFRRWLRILTFRASAKDYAALGPTDLLLGLCATWLVGMGRYWDDSKAGILQHLGLGSVIYVFVLGALLWAVAKPIMPTRISYLGILAFVTMTSPPAAFYAIPVERWMSLESANQINLIFLCIVALWRVGLFFHFLRRGGGFDWMQTIICGTAPLAIIFSTLVALNLHHVVFNIMGGIREADRTSQDAAYGLLWLLSILSMPISAACGLIWISFVILRLLRGRRPH